MKKRIIKKIIVLLMLLCLFFICKVASSQCTSTDLWTEGFESGSLTMTAPLSSDYIAGTCNISNGRYIIVSDAEGCSHPADNWKDGSAETAHSGTYAMLVDGSNTLANNKVLCKSINLINGTKYNFSAWVTSPWEENNSNEPSIYLTIGTTTISGNQLINQDASPGTMPYVQMNCYYTYTGSSGAVDVCINMAEYGGVANGYGNDLLLDDISFSSVSGAGCPASGSCGTPAPIKLISFEGIIQSNNALLKWASASEKKSSHIVIEKSLDAINFYQVGSVLAKGNSTQLNNYIFYDNNFKVTSYYRLKMIDLDDSFEYSNVIALNKNYKVNITYNLGEIKILTNSNVTIKIYSLLGQELINENINTNKDYNFSSTVLLIISDESNILISEICNLGF